jgi:type II secretory pathway component PulF
MIIYVVLLLLFIYLGWKRPALAVITCPLTATTICIIGLTNQTDVFAVISAVVIFFVTLITVLLSKSDVTKDRWAKIFAKYFLYIFLFCSLCVLMVQAFGPYGLLGILFLILLIGTIIAFNLTSKHATASYIISTIGSSIRQNLPLPMALELAGSGYKNKYSVIFQRIKKWLVQGYSLSESIKRGYPQCPGYVAAMIAAAEPIDQLPNALKSIQDSMTFTANENRKIKPVHPLYAVIVMSFTFLVLWGIMSLIMPQLRDTFLEITGGSEQQFPALTRLFMNATVFNTVSFWIVLGIIAVIIFVLIPFSIYIRFRPRRPESPYLISRAGDFIKWHIPVLHWFERNYSMVQITEMLRLSLNSGCSINESIRNTIRLDVNNCIKKYIGNWLGKVERGDNIAAAARSSRLGSSLAWAFDERVNQGNTLTILETLERVYRSNYSYCVNLIKFITWPCVILFIGITVGTAILAIFSPYVMSISMMANTITP